MRTTRETKRIHQLDNEHVRVTLDIGIPNESDEPAPTIAECRHAVLALSVPPDAEHPSARTHYVVYDRFLSRIVNGVFMFKVDALGVAGYYNRDLSAPQDMSPNGDALALIYPSDFTCEESDEEE